ncbi:NAD(P)H-dependent oxidoreductase [uncultured Methanocorpusculum sp.]|nr:NAD(P)H-dependent oxidoreductase [uncultured Methanocorpusculum sp.]
MTKKIVALFGSNVIGGNTDKLLTEAIRGAEDAGCIVERLDIVSLDLSGCRQIYHCMEKEHCVILDEAEKYHTLLKEADGIIIATPVMTYGIPGQLKSFMDRCQPFYMAKYYRKHSFISDEHAKIRKTLFICISGMNTLEVFIGPVLTVKAFCQIIDTKYFDELLQNDMDNIKKIESKPEVMKAAYEKGRALGEAITKARG